VTLRIIRLAFEAGERRCGARLLGAVVARMLPRPAKQHVAFTSSGARPRNGKLQ
jgi:hypothetical protein